MPVTCPEPESEDYPLKIEWAHWYELGRRLDELADFLGAPSWFARLRDLPASPWSVSPDDLAGEFYQYFKVLVNDGAAGGFNNNDTCSNVLVVDRFLSTDTWGNKFVLPERMQQLAGFTFINETDPEDTQLEENLFFVADEDGCLCKTIYKVRKDDTTGNYTLATVEEMAGVIPPPMPVTTCCQTLVVPELYEALCYNQEMIPPGHVTFRASRNSAVGYYTDGDGNHLPKPAPWLPVLDEDEEPEVDGEGNLVFGDADFVNVAGNPEEIIPCTNGAAEASVFFVHDVAEGGATFLIAAGRKVTGRFVFPIRKRWMNQLMVQISSLTQCNVTGGLAVKSVWTNIDEEDPTYDSWFSDPGSIYYGSYATLRQLAWHCAVDDETHEGWGCNGGTAGCLDDYAVTDYYSRGFNQMGDMFEAATNVEALPLYYAFSDATGSTLYSDHLPEGIQLQTTSDYASNHPGSYGMCLPWLDSCCASGATCDTTGGYKIYCETLASLQRIVTGLENSLLLNITYAGDGGGMAVQYNAARDLLFYIYEWYFDYYSFTTEDQEAHIDARMPCLCVENSWCRLDGTTATVDNGWSVVDTSGLSFASSESFEHPVTVTAMAAHLDAIDVFCNDLNGGSGYADDILVTGDAAIGHENYDMYSSPCVYVFDFCVNEVCVENVNLGADEYNWVDYASVQAVAALASLNTMALTITSAWDVISMEAIDFEDAPCIEGGGAVMSIGCSTQRSAYVPRDDYYPYTYTPPDPP